LSAIVGVFYPQGRPVDREVVDRMVATMAHRGPDGNGAWTQGPVGLGHLLLRTTPESKHEHLPLVNTARDLVLTADARIDNREELIAQLGLGDRPAAEITDAELILAAYERWGERSPERLLGDFAFAIWDGQRQELFCARDHFGVKPLYYYHSDAVFAFATEIKGLFGAPGVPRRLNETMVAEHLAGTEQDPRVTYYQGIVRLPARHWMRVGRSGAEERCYWSLDPTRELRLGSDAEYAEAFRELFTETVRCRMRSAHPIGTMLSGGLDSSSVTCVARKLMAEKGEGPLFTFSAVFDTVTESDERSYIEAVLAQGNMEPHFLHADRVSPLTDLDRVIWHLDQPASAGNLYVNWCSYNSARERDVRVMLDGFDGDTTVSHGHFYLIELLRASRWLTLLREVKAYRKRSGPPPSWEKTFWRHVWRHHVDPALARYPVLREGRRAWRYAARRLPRRQVQPSRRFSFEALLAPEFAGRVNGALHTPESRAAPRTEREAHFRTLTWPLHASTLEMMAMAVGAFGMETRFPFWDKRLVEFCLALPAEQKRRWGWGRLVVRPALDGILPAAVQWRGTKSNLGPSFNHGLMTFERERMDDAILHRSSVIADYVNIPVLTDTYHRYVSGDATRAEGLAVWRAFSLALWLQRMDLTPSADG
jgi:asparagine synthase (glutamine-hydrolysing)